MLNYRDAVLYDEDVSLFRPPAWLNDACLNFGFRLLERDDVFLMDPAVYSYMMLQMDDEDDLPLPRHKEHRVVLIPISDAKDLGSFRGSHWSLLAYYPSRNLFEHYDSMRSSGHSRHAEAVVRKIAGSGIKAMSVETPQQTNGYDCGAYVLYIAKLLVEDRKEAVSEARPEEVAKFRLFVADKAREMLRLKDSS